MYNNQGNDLDNPQFGTKYNTNYVGNNSNLVNKNRTQSSKPIDRKKEYHTQS